MEIRITILLLIPIILYMGCSTDSEGADNQEPAPTGMYYPPNDATTWETVSTAQLQWNENKVQDLYDYLQLKKSKGFIVLKDGRIVLEKYFNGHSKDKNWVWFSAAKSLTATVIGIAQDEGIININNKTSDYLGANWSALTTDQQNLITVKHHLSMSTGLEDHAGDFVPWTCTEAICLTHTADAGTRWAYHQAAFTLLQDMVSQNSGKTFANYYKEKLRDKIGMNGTWSKLGVLNLYSSTSRSMARFGLLMQNEGDWGEQTIVSKAYFNEMTTASQDLNKSYGYLWWLNGKDSFMGTSSQEVFQGALIPNAPSDMFVALGANDQKIYVVPSKGLVIVRSGESAGTEQLGLSSFDNELWAKINAVIP